VDSAGDLKKRGSFNLDSMACVACGRACLDCICLCCHKDEDECSCQAVDWCQPDASERPSSAPTGRVRTVCIVVAIVADFQDGSQVSP
jgi:hypothetical protein